MKRLHYNESLYFIHLLVFSHSPGSYTGTALYVSIQSVALSQTFFVSLTWTLWRSAGWVFGRMPHYGELSSVFLMIRLNTWILSSFPGGASGKEYSCQKTQNTWPQSLGQEDPLEKEVAIHASILTWRTPWTKEPGRL